ncbi:MAG: ATP-binding cassette domain-containing protein [Ramlibacter sp.]|nr:ATP-binding cassette domain-containing protein [Ramlibacter sp.]
MSDTVISVNNLSKRYLVGHEGPQERYRSLRDTLVRHGKNLARKTRDMAHGRQIVHGDTVEEFWALNDVSFHVKRGEVLGIIGRNGAGKSTLLKILSRITEPTSGRVELAGRIASLLEVGTGFHPELTGRENIFLNGAILGMTRAEIKRKFDEIVEFAGVTQFLDTPVKRYSSGMYVRLAFAVAAHLEPDILIIDEVLAVGDADFQKKCLGKMKDVANGGRTVLFVSHQMEAVQRLCTKVATMNMGRLQGIDLPNQAIEAYSNSRPAQTRLEENAPFDDLQARFVHVEQGHFLEIVCEISQIPSRTCEVECLLSNAHGTIVIAGYSAEQLSLRGSGKRKFFLDCSMLANGIYYPSIQIVEPLQSIYLRYDFSLPIALSRVSNLPRGKCLDQSWNAGFVEGIVLSELI